MINEAHVTKVLADHYSAFSTLDVQAILPTSTNLSAHRTPRSAPGAYLGCADLHLRARH